MPLLPGANVIRLPMAAFELARANVPPAIVTPPLKALAAFDIVSVPAPVFRMPPVMLVNWLAICNVSVAKSVRMTSVVAPPVVMKPPLIVATLPTSEPAWLNADLIRPPPERVNVLPAAIVNDPLAPLTAMFSVGMDKLFCAVTLVAPPPVISSLTF